MRKTKRILKENQKAIKSVTVSDGVTRIGEHSLGYVFEGDTNLDAVLNPGFTVKCKAGFAAEKYAKENGITCELI